LPNGAVWLAKLTLSIGSEVHLVSIPILNEDGTVSPLLAWICLSLEFT
jgi:hypothetical protein